MFLLFLVWVFIQWVKRIRHKRRVKEFFESGRYIDALSLVIRQGETNAWTICLQRIMQGDDRSKTMLLRHWPMCPSNLREAGLELLGDPLTAYKRDHAYARDSAITWYRLFAHAGRENEFPIAALKTEADWVLVLRKSNGAQRIADALVQDRNMLNALKDPTTTIGKELRKSPGSCGWEWYAEKLAAYERMLEAERRAEEERLLQERVDKLVSQGARENLAREFIKDVGIDDIETVNSMEKYVKWVASRGGEGLREDIGRYSKWMWPLAMKCFPKSELTVENAFELAWHFMENDAKEALGALVIRCKRLGLKISLSDYQERRCTSCDGCGVVGAVYDAPLERDCHPGYVCSACDGNGGEVKLRITFTRNSDSVTTKTLRFNCRRWLITEKSLTRLLEGGPPPW